MPLALKPRTPRAAQLSTSLRIRSAVQSLLPSPVAPCRSTGPELWMRGPTCSPRSIRRRAPIIPSGSTSPPGNVDVTPLARKMSGLTVYSSTRPCAEQIDRVVRVEVEEAREGSSRSGASVMTSRRVEVTSRQIRADLEKDRRAGRRCPVFGTSVSRTPSNNWPPVMTMSPAWIAGTFWASGRAVSPATPAPSEQSAECASCVDGKRVMQNCIASSA